MSKQTINMTNEQFINATECVLCYAGHTQEEIETYKSVLNALAGTIDIAKAKSLRYEHDRKIIGSVRTPKHIEVDITGPTPAGEIPVTVVEYYAREETTPRLAFFSDKFTKSFSLRYFNEQNKFKRFSKLSWVNAINSFNFWGSSILQYRVQDSKVDRFAVYFLDCDKSLEEFKKLLPSNSNSDADKATSTSFFGG